MLKLDELSDDELTEVRDQMEECEMKIIALVAKYHPFVGVAALTAVTTGIHKWVGKHNPQNQKFCEDIGVPRGENLFGHFERELTPVLDAIKKANR